jgi:hypothetical protein
MLHVGLRSGPDPWFLSLELDTRHDDDEGSSDSKLVILLMAAATLVAAGAAIGIAASPAGQGDEIAATIDAVNYHNDQVAWRLAQCRAKGVDTP